MKKETIKRIFDFIVIYGWAILVILIFIVALIYFGASKFTLNSKNWWLDEPNKVCNNLEKIVNNELVIYPEIIIQRALIERDWNFKVINIDGKTVKARQYDNDGVMCEMKAELCDYNYFCFDVKMLIPINYTEHRAWLNANTNKT